MNDLKRNVAYWIIPQGFQKIFSNFLERSNQILKWDNQEKALLKKNLALKDIHNDDRCFILATGPSIKHQDLKQLQGETCIAVSNFFVHPDYALIDPKYYCIAPYHLPITENAWQKWMNEIEISTGNAKIFFSTSDRVRNLQNGKFKNKTLYFLKFGGSREYASRCGLDLTRQVFGPQSVTVMALMVAIYMGFKEIYLLGCDHDSILHINESRHFYPETANALVRSGYTEWFQQDLEEQFLDYISLWKEYKLIQKIADVNGVFIGNATEGGLLDVFPRIEYKSLFEW